MQGNELSERVFSVNWFGLDLKPGLSMSALSKLTATATVQALPLRISLYGFAQYAGQRECCSGLAHLCRFRPAADRYCPQALRQRTLWHRPVGNCLCAGHNDHRPLPVGLSLGTVSHHQSCGEVAYAVGFARQHPKLYSHLGREDARGERARHAEAYPHQGCGRQDVGLPDQ